MESITNKLTSGILESPRQFSPLTRTFNGMQSDIFGNAKFKTYCLFSSDGVNLGKDFGTTITFCDKPRSKEMSAAFSAVYLDMKYWFNKGELGAISLCHEIGHVLNPNNLHLISSIYTENEPGSDAYYLERFLKFSKQDNDIWRTEVEAWEYGKIVSDVLGINENLYHYRMTCALRTYYVHYSLDKIIHLNKVLSLGLVDLNYEIDFYDIWSQELLRISVSDLIERTIEQKERLEQIKNSPEFINTFD